MIPIKFDVLLLFSGGLDSTVLFKLALNNKLNLRCVLFDYGQQHVVELDYARKFCDKFKVQYDILKLELPILSNLTEDKHTYEGVSPYHVPARNLIFLSIAASICESRDIPLIWYGANYEDRELLFPDCYQEWVFHLNNVLKINGSIPIKVEAPLLGMQKQTIKSLADSFNIYESDILSGYGEK